MISANEARKKTEKGLQLESEKDLKEIYAEIEEECEKGNYELYYRGIISKEATAALKEKGYKVRYISGEFDDFGNYYGGFIKINWRRENNWKIKIKNLLQKWI